MRRLAIAHWAQVLFGLEYYLGAGARDKTRGAFEAYTSACSILKGSDFDAIVRRSAELSKGRLPA